MKAEDQVAADIARPAGQLQRPLKRLISSRYQEFYMWVLLNQLDQELKAVHPAVAAFRRVIFYSQIHSETNRATQQVSHSFLVYLLRVIRALLSSTRSPGVLLYLCVCVWRANSATFFQLSL